MAAVVTRPELETLSLGGGCHWCPEAVVRSLAGVGSVDQGWLASAPPHDGFSEGVTLRFDPRVIRLPDLVEVHLHTRASTSDHRLRARYRSAFYFHQASQAPRIGRAMDRFGRDFAGRFVTLVLPFVAFRPSREAIRDYHRTRPDAPFCKTYIEPKLD